MYKKIVIIKEIDNMNIKDNVLRKYLENVYIVGGNTCSGKSTMSKLIAKKYGFILYQMDKHYEEHRKMANENNQYIQAFCDIAKQLYIGVVITRYTKGINRPQNSAFVISKNGEILMKYSKVHTCNFADEQMLECRNEFRVCDFEGIKIGIMICYDR